MFGFFKKSSDQPTFDPTNITVADFRTGFIFDYELSSWEIIESYEYTWENGDKNKEFKVKSSFETLYLSVENEDELVLMEKISPSALIPNFKAHMRSNDTPPEQFSYQNEQFFLENDDAGIFKNLDKNEEDEFIVWSYASKNGTLVDIEQWDDDEFEAAIGQKVEPHLITNILPGSA